jgi:hypothetical protein
MLRPLLSEAGPAVPISDVYENSGAALANEFIEFQRIAHPVA